nr:ATP-binding cassette sub-family A member 3-like isoform X2 [Halyomorpha halys]
MAVHRVLLRGHSNMAFTVWKALLYKSFSIYRIRYKTTIADILWPCLLILFLAIVKNQLTPDPSPSPSPSPTPTPSPKYYHYQGDNRESGLQSMDLRLDQPNSYPKHLEKKIKGHGNFTKPRFRDQQSWDEEKFHDRKNKVNISTEVHDYKDNRNQMMREICTIQYGFFLLLCFVGTWSGAGTLAHAERMSGTVERMRMNGVSDWSIMCSYIVHGGIKQLLSALLFSLLLKIQLGGPALIQNIDFFSLFVAIFLLSLHSTVYFLGVASFFNSTILRGIIGTASYIYLFLWASKQQFSVTAQIFGNMLAPFSLVITSLTACGLEDSGGVTLKNLISATDNNDIPLLVVPLLMIFGSALVLLIFYYLLNISPGPYGSARPVYFILPQCLQDYLRPEKNKSDRSKSSGKFRTGLYEKTPPNIEIGIKIENLYKKYGNLTSLKKLSLNIFSGQITALLGHNGAGKTTTLSILSGMLSPTSGSAFYQGYDIFTNLGRFRKDLGLCPQNNLLHPNLKVINQLIFFAMLGGLSKKEAEENANDLLNLVGILEKKYVEVSQLSGGMQRKLCIALALVGKPRVLILDEPTSGVDPESRREIWNILLESRENRIMILTTHFMEEADALGDQIAIMNHGEIVCYGSPIFLKKHYGAGYNITISSDQMNHKEIFKTVTEKLPEATIIGEHKEWLKCKLPFDKTEDFPELFEQLESNNQISGIGINCTTMEDVYLKVEEGEGGEIQSVAKSSFLPEITSSEQEKIMVYIYRFLGLVKKSMICSLARWFKTFLVVAIVPVVAAYIAMDEYNTDFNKYHDHMENDSQSKEGVPVTGSVEQPSNDFMNSMSSCRADPTLLLRVYMFSMWLTYVIFIVSSTFSSFVHKDRLSTVKHLILMTGISPVTYWSSVLFWDTVIYLIFVLISWTTFIILDSSDVFSRDSGIYVLFLVLFLSGISMISSVYFVTLLFKTMRTVVVVYFAGVFTCGFIGYFIIQIQETHPYSNIFKLQPVTATMLALIDFTTLAAKKQNCEGCGLGECPDIMKSAYLKDDNLTNDLLFLVLDLFLYIFLVILTDYGLFPFLWDKIKSLYIGQIDNSTLNKVDSDVAREKSRVDGLHTTDKRKEIIGIVDGLAKKYSRSMVAVVDVTFAVSKGECFGLLGVNGAGKSTTFNMLTGILYPTKGNFFIKGYSLMKEKAKCLSMIGYCPQHSALIESLTARQMLTLFARLRLIPSEYVVKEVQKWITLFGLEEYSDIPCKNYSGGNKRKLNAAMAFIGDPSIILLDEPTTGVDPFIRRNLWNIIEVCGSNNQAIIISSHSMDECEAVCNRLTIMARGKMECIGNTQRLKALYGSGYVIKITLSPHTDNEVGALKRMIESTFSPHCELKDEHQVLLHYHIKTNTYRISVLFDIMQRVKNEFKIVDDYIITDSSLEEVFLGFAKNKNNEGS